MAIRDDNQLRKQVEQQARRLKKAERERPTLVAQTFFIGRLGLVFVIPVVGGAYLGRWLDSLASGYSTRWTISLILIGLACGAFNLYLTIKDSGDE